MQAGRLGPALTIDTGETARTVAVGDVVVGLHNDVRHNLRNGARGVVTALGGEGSLSIRLADGSDATATPGYLAAGRLDHGYAMTVHKAQGMTTGPVLLLGSDELYREAGYVGLSRGRIDNRVYVVVDDALVVSVTCAGTTSDPRDMALRGRRCAPKGTTPEAPTHGGDVERRAARRRV